MYISIHYISHALYFPYIIFPIHYISHTLHFPYTTFPIHYISHTLHFACTIFPIHYISNTLHFPYTTFPIHYTEHTLQAGCSGLGYGTRLQVYCCMYILSYIKDLGRNVLFSLGPKHFKRCWVLLCNLF